MGRCRQRRREGALAAELAVLLPFVSFLIVVALDFARVYQATLILQNCAESGGVQACGAGDPPLYRPAGGSDLLELVGRLLGSSWETPSKTSKNEDREKRAREAAVREGASLRPGLRGEHVTIEYQGSNVNVIVEYEMELLTPVFSASRKIKLTRRVTMPLMP